MHYAIALFGIFACWKWGDLGKWRSYLPTLLYIAAANLTYSYLTGDRRLWQFENHLPIHDRKIIDLLYFFIIDPAIAFVFLSKRPDKPRSLLWVLPLWTIGFTILEYIVYLLRGITYHNGWTLGWSLLFYAIMFPMLMLHDRKPLLAYVLSVAMTAFYMKVFEIPLIEK
jgi:ABC-type multidrug transport system permease subunit